MSTPNLEDPTESNRAVNSASRRVRLREFQAQLVERMHAAASVKEQSSQLGVMIGQTRWLLELQEASEIVSLSTITKVPLTRGWYLGLTNIRGNLISVVDLARFQGMAPTQIDKDCRIIAFAPALAFNGGLLVSRVMGLRSVSDMVPDPVTAEEMPDWTPRRYIDRDAHVWNELKLSSIVQDPEFLHVGL